MGKLHWEKKMGEFWAPGAEIWLFKKKNMDRSIDLAVQHIDKDDQKSIFTISPSPFKYLEIFPDIAAL